MDFCAFTQLAGTHENQHKMKWPWQGGQGRAKGGADLFQEQRPIKLAPFVTRKFTTGYRYTEPPIIPPSNIFVLFQFNFYFPGFRGSCLVHSYV